MTLRITEERRLLGYNARRCHELRWIDTDMLARAVGWPLAMIEDIENANQVDLTLNDIDQPCETLAVLPFDLFVPSGHR